MFARAWDNDGRGAFVNTSGGAYGVLRFCGRYIYSPVPFGLTMRTVRPQCDLTLLTRPTSSASF